jgi:6-phosphogluconolactonase/glucosamine-6-phosphate isomerase/deaminase
MEIIRCNDRKETVQYIDSWCKDNIKNLNAKSIFLPAGNTPIPLYKKWEEIRPSYLDNIQFHQVDEVITGPKIGIFEQFFKEHLPSYQKQMNYISSSAMPCDMAILGLGLNGHIAFHEPGIEKNFEIGCVKLTDITCSSLDMPANSWGVSYGLKAFLNCKKILLVVNGKSKKDILKEVINRNPSIPASHLLDHKGLTIIADLEAYPIN